MFTGIIEGQGKVAAIRSTGEGKHVAIQTDLDLGDVKIGDSVAVNGACLTVVKLDGSQFAVDISPETVSKTTFRFRKVGDSVNIERALRLSDRLDGHLVSGHIDGVGTLRRKTQQGNAVIIAFQVPQFLSRYMIQKGSVAVDGISLTINRCDAGTFEVSIIPHTAEETHISRLKEGEPVNIETDMIGKYVEQFVSASDQPSSQEKTERSSIDLNLLAKNGFL